MKKYGIKVKSFSGEESIVKNRFYSSKTSAKKAATYFNNHQLLQPVYGHEFDSKYTAVEIKE